MRILIVTNLYPNPREPHRATFNRRQFAALAHHHDVRVIAPIAWTRSGALTRGDARVSEREIDGVQVEHPHYFFTPKVLRGFYGQFYLRSVRACFQRAVRDFRPDVVLGSWAYPDGWATVRLAQEARLPVAIKVHGSDLMTVRDEGATRNRFSRTVEALRDSDAVIAVGERLRGRAIEMGADPRRVHLVYSGVNTATFCPGSRAEARSRLGIESSVPLVLFAGNLVPVKGLDVLVDALHRLLGLGLSYQCVLVGVGPLRKELAARTEARGLTSRVQFVGARPQTELADWYRACDCLVLPSRSEGVPNVLLEAAACGASAIASDVGGVPEVCDPAGLVPPGDAVALSERIRAFLDPATRPAPSRPFRPGSWDDSARSLAKVLGGIIPGRSHTKAVGLAA